MTVRELITALEKFPGEIEVFVAERKTEFGYGLVNSAYSKEIGFSEDWDAKKHLATDTVVVLDEE